MDDISTIAMELATTRNNIGECYFLDPFIVFKGKLNAAVSRSKFHDSADLRWLADRYKTSIAPNVGQLNLVRFGLAMQRYPELRSTFRELGIDTDAARQAAAGYDVTRSSPPSRGDVQMGLLTQSRSQQLTESTTQHAESTAARTPVPTTATSSHLTASNDAPGWVWDAHARRYKIWSNGNWVWDTRTLPPAQSSQPQSQWVWDAAAQRYKIWSGGQWIFDTRTG